MDAVHWADIDARPIFHADAGLCDDVCHPSHLLLPDPPPILPGQGQLKERFQLAPQHQDLLTHGRLLLQGCALICRDDLSDPVNMVAQALEQCTLR
jgi:hypothetical protein